MSRNVIMGTLGVPLAVIGAAEAGVYFGGKRLFSLSTKGYGYRMAYEGGSELLSNGGNLGDVNLLCVGASTFASNIGADFIGSKYSYSLNDGWDSYGVEETAIRFSVGQANLKIHNSLGKFSNYGGAINAMSKSFTLAGYTGTKLITK